MTDGIVLIDKPTNMTSFGVVARARRVLSEKNNRKTKVGHTGTLDPFASGLMILTIGKECKNAMHYTKLNKTYQTVIKLGETSTTGDPEGQIIHFSDRIPTQKEVKQALTQFVGEISQKPPIYSAIKIGGRRAYELARKGEDIDMPTRQVTIYNLELIDYHYPYIELRAHVSSGSYIRTLAEDIGKTLKTGAYCRELRRSSIDRWSLKDATTLEDFMKNPKVLEAH